MTATSQMDYWGEFPGWDLSKSVTKCNARDPDPASAYYRPNWDELLTKFLDVRTPFQKKGER